MNKNELIAGKMNYMAIRLLEEFGNMAPNQQQIDLMEKILSSLCIDRRLLLDENLTAMEKACLYWAAKGMTSEETATILKIAISTVETHRTKIKKKLRCKNMAHAVFEGVRYGFLGG